MRNKEKIVRILIIVVVVLVVSCCLGMIAKTMIESNQYKVVVKNKKLCNKQEELYYEGLGRNVYIYCLDSVKVNGKELKDLLLENSSEIEVFISKIKKNESYDDGGSIMYYGDNFNVLKCNTLLGNKDIYIGTPEMRYEDSFCSRIDENLYGKFTKTYRILNVAESNDSNYLYVTLRQFQAEEVETVKVLRSLFSNYEVNKYYEFTFRKNGLKVENNIKSIFENTIIEKVNLTDKTGLEQINEDI